MHSLDYEGNDLLINGGGVSTAVLCSESDGRNIVFSEVRIDLPVTVVLSLRSVTSVRIVVWFVVDFLLCRQVSLDQSLK